MGVIVLELFTVFSGFSLGRVVLYNVFMMLSLPKTLIKTLAKHLTKNLAKNLAGWVVWPFTGVNREGLGTV